ncbi:sulfotransferase family protein [Thioclava sp. FR2]|uniref:sulfotransferase family protein n=1 Tax=Thioclava sp. FR2 TaxID=3445780 RepID=UPI003EC0E2E0
MALKIIGAGMGRTGTESMRFALNRLGMGPTHHMVECLENEQTGSRWRAFAAGQAAADWGALFEGYSSAVDWPSVSWWREIWEANPGAKVILTWRSAESWWGSFEKTIREVLLKAEDNPDHLPMNAVRRLLGEAWKDREAAIAAYDAHVEDVKRTVPEDRLLVHKLGDGWGPLCAFLGVPVPDDPYPRVNSTAEFQQRFTSAP